MCFKKQDNYLLSLILSKELNVVTVLQNLLTSKINIDQCWSTNHGFSLQFPRNCL